MSREKKRMINDFLSSNEPTSNDNERNKNVS